MTWLCKVGLIESQLKERYWQQSLGITKKG
jgi:hypothetical protein